jgi:O-antigen/teichoic acid export membrane protein
MASTTAAVTEARPSPDHNPSRDVRGLAINILTLIAQAAMPAFHMILTHGLGDNGYGRYTWSNNLVDLFSILTLFGMDQAVVRQVSLARDDEDSLVKAVGGALRSVVLSGLGIAVLLFVLAPFVAEWVHKPDVVTPLRVLAIGPVFYHATTVLLAATQAKRVMHWDFWTRGIVQPLVLVISTSTALRMNTGVVGACVAVALGMAITTLVACVLTRRTLPVAKIVACALTSSVDRTLVRAALPMVAAGVAWSLQGRIDGFLLARYATDASLGAYAACFLYVNSISQTRGTVVPLLLPDIAPRMERGDREGLRARVQLLTRWVALMAVPLCALFAGFGGPFLTVFGKGFSAGTTAMAILAVGHLINAISLAPYVLAQSALGHLGGYTAVASTLLQCVLVPLLAPRYGLVGAALSASVGIGLGQAIQSAITWWTTSIHGISWGLVKVFVSGILCLVAGRTVFEILALPLLAKLSIAITVAAVVYLVAVIALGLHPEERSMITTLRARIQKR